ncbi:hypothetical protein [Aquisphaera giovannonii]|nr:hypothetical protein [Aquisphaera giovannonii]
MEKLEALKYRGAKQGSHMESGNGMVDACIAIVRQHEAEQPQEAVERVARAISAWRWDQKTDEPWERLKPSVQQAYRDQARAALDAMGAGTGSAPDAQGVSDDPLGNLGTIPLGGNPAAPASEAFSRVEEALRFFKGNLLHDGDDENPYSSPTKELLEDGYELAMEALAALPALKP